MTSPDFSPVPHLIEDYAPPTWLTLKADIHFDLHLVKTIVRVNYDVQLNPDLKFTKIPELFLNGNGLEFLSLRLNGYICEPCLYEITKDGLLFHNPPSDRFNLQIENSICPSQNTSLEGLYHSGSILCTQNEPEGFRKIMYSIDRPDNLTRFRVTLVGDKSSFPVLLSNGNLLSTSDLGDGKLEAKWEDPFPKPSYLFAIVAGDLYEVTDQYTTGSGRNVSLKIFVDNKNRNKTEFAMDALKLAMRWDEETFGLEYDLDLYMIVAVDDFNMGAMENKGLNLFNSKLILADKKSATDETFESILGVVAHEYFHNWTGNRVTLRNWFNLTLKEGLTVFRDQWFTEDQTDVSVKRIKDVLFLMEHQFPEDAGPMSHPVLPKSYKEMNNFYTVTVYEKGAEIIRMLSVLLGRDGFKKGLSHYLKTYDGRGVTFEEFLLSMEFTNETDLKIFRNWYHRSGTPVLILREFWDKSLGEFSIEVEDDTESELALMYPISLALFDIDGKLQSEEVLTVLGKSYRKTWCGWKEKPILSVLRNFSAPVKLQYEKDISELTLLAKQETDGFTKFFALQEVIHKEIKNSFDNKQEIDTTRIFEIFVSYFKTKNDLPKDYLSYLINIPSIIRIADVLECFDYEKVYNIRFSLVNNIANHFQTEFEELYMENMTSEPTQIRTEIGKRRLKNTALYYLFHCKSLRGIIGDRALIQQTTANHMSEELGALKVLCEMEHPQVVEALTLFYNKWESDALVLDYWFSVQVSYGSGALIRIKKLIKHDKFNWKNPNRVRALIGAFGRNSLSFHHADSGGYLFLGECIEKLNAINPQISASLAKVFQGARLQSGTRRNVARAEIQRLLKLPNLSRDLEEIIFTILKGWDLRS